MVTIHPPAPLVGEPKKTKKKRKEGRKTPKQWQTGYSPRPPTSSDQNETLYGGWAAVCSYTCQVWSKSVKGIRRCGWSKMALSYYFGQWLIQQLVLPYKPWLRATPLRPVGYSPIRGLGVVKHSNVGQKFSYVLLTLSPCVLIHKYLHVAGIDLASASAFWPRWWSLVLNRTTKSRECPYVILLPFLLYIGLL